MTRMSFFSYIDIKSFKKKILKDKSIVEDNKNYEYVVVVGGDGTFASALKKFKNQNVKLILINLGHLGFLSNINENDNFKELLKQEFKSYKYIEALNLKTKKLYTGINEITLFKLDTSVNYSVIVDDNYFYSFFGTGVYLSTALGTSGINRSYSGPLLFDNDSYCLGEIAPSIYPNVTNLKQHLVLNKKHLVKIKIGTTNELYLKEDGQVSKIDCGEYVFSLKTSKAKIIDPFQLERRIKKIQVALLGK